MSLVISELTGFLERYERQECTLAEIHDAISLRLQWFADNGSENEENVTMEVLCFIYEIQDGVTDEEDFRRWIKVFLKSPVAYAERTPTLQRLRKRAILRERRALARKRRSRAGGKSAGRAKATASSATVPGKQTATR